MIFSLIKFSGDNGKVFHLCENYTYDLIWASQNNPEIGTIITLYRHEKMMAYKPG